MTPTRLISAPRTTDTVNTRVRDRRTTKRIAVVVVIVLACAGIGLALYANRWKIWPKRFAVVEPGWL